MAYRPNEPYNPRTKERIAQPLFEKTEYNRSKACTLVTHRDTFLPKLISGGLCVLDAECLVGRCA